MRQLDNHASDAGALALKTLSANQDLAPGRYLVSIEVNRSFFDQREIEFTANAQGDGLSPCLSRQLLLDMGIRLDSLAETESLTDACVDLPRLVPGALIELHGGQLLLSLSIPQIAMRRDVVGYVDPQRWDYGINSAFINYQVSAQQGRNPSGHNSSQDLFLNSGLNLGAWRLRSNNAFRSDAQGERSWTRAYTYVQRDLPGMHSQLTVGETFNRQRERGRTFGVVDTRNIFVFITADPRNLKCHGFGFTIRWKCRPGCNLQQDSGIQ